MIRFEERDDVTVQNPPAGEVVLFYTDGAFRIKDSAGEVTTITTVEGLEEVAEATEPKVYVALLTQTGTDAPVATVLKNTLGGVPVWSYNDVGSYRITTAGLFTVNKTVGIISLNYTGNSDWGGAYIAGLTVNQFDIHTHDQDTITFSNDVLERTLIEIRVYP